MLQRLRSNWRKFMTSTELRRTYRVTEARNFMGQWKHFVRGKKVKMTKSWAYCPQSQGKVERSHRKLRKKTNYDLVKQGRKGVNWVKNSLEYSKCLNNDKREELGWRSAFEVYYETKSNELVKCGVPANREKEFNVQKSYPAIGKCYICNSKTCWRRKRKGKKRLQESLW